MVAVARIAAPGLTTLTVGGVQSLDAVTDAVLVVWEVNIAHAVVGMNRNTATNARMPSPHRTSRAVVAAWGREGLGIARVVAWGLRVVAG
jgi:hypothetical protein